MFNKNTFLKSIILIISITTFNAHTFSFKNPTAYFYEYMDKKLCEYWGDEEASEKFQKQIRIFLEHLGVKNASTLPIRKIKDSLKNIKKIAFTRPTGIWINENYFKPDEEITSEALYVFAHEACHYRHQQAAMHILLSCVAIHPFTPTIGTLTVIFTNYPILKKISQLINTKPEWQVKIWLSLIALYNILLPNLAIINNQIIISVSKEIEKEADLLAAKMLCEMEYQYVIEDRIKHCKEMIGKELNFDTMHPKAEEAIEYFQKFLDEWNKEQITQFC